MDLFKGIPTPKVIYETDSELNGHIRVIEFKNYRKVNVDNFDQSVSADYPPCSRLVWGKTAKILKENLPSAQKVLILGLGGGTMATLISREMPEVAITSVELDPQMVDIAKRFFAIDSLPNHKVILADALRVVVEPEVHGIELKSIDAIIVDIFVGEKYPDLGKSGNFIAALKKLLRSGGMIIFNRIYLEHHQDDVNDFVEYVSEFLRDVKCLIVAGYTNSDNMLIYGFCE